MKVPTPRKLDSGNWFIQLRLGGESVSITETSEKKCVASARLIKAEYLAGKRDKTPSSDKLTLKQAIDNYIASRSNTLSPSTVRGYNIIKDNRFASVMDKKIKDIDSWQSLCNAEAKICAPKTLKNSWAFIASVLREYGMPVPRVTLPQLAKKERPYLDPDDIKVFLRAIDGAPCEIPALLALHSLRVSEICALTWEKNVDLKGKRIFVSGALVPDENNKYVLKATNKNATSQRYVPIMIDTLYNKLKTSKSKKGPVVASTPTAINKQINKVCRNNNLPTVGVHGLRHSFASLAYHLGMPEKIAMQIGGWSDAGTMHKIYTHLAQKDVAKYEVKMSSFYKDANENANGQ